MNALTFVFTLALFGFLPLFGYAGSYDFSSQDYNTAKKSDSYVRFDMASTKVGIITSHFSGYLKKFKVQGEIKGEEVGSGSTITFNAKDLDTDIDGRNEKMWDKCLDSENHPTLQIKLNQPVLLDNTAKNIPATLSIRGEDHAITLNVKVSRENDLVIADINGEISIKELKIPDPSILVASVKDKIGLKAHFIIKEK